MKADFTVHKLNVKRLDELAIYANAFGILLHRGAREVIVGEIPLDVRVCGVNRMVDIYASAEGFKIIGEIEKDRELLQGELLALKSKMKCVKESFEILGFLISERQDYDAELLWSTTIKVDRLDDLPIFRIDVRRGLAWP